MSKITNEIVMINHIEKLGIEKDSKILDFGCGDGTYTIPFARLLGRKGKIFAVDNDTSKLEKLREKAIKTGLNEKIEIIHNKNNLAIPLENESMDFTLLYNVACCIHGKDNQEDLIELIQDIHRIAKKSGRLIINFKGKNLEKRIEKALPEIQTFFKLEEKEMKKYFLENERVRHRFFYYFVKME